MDGRPNRRNKNVLGVVGTRLKIELSVEKKNEDSTVA